MSRLSTRTVLFTDLVGSTAHRSAVGDDAADALQRRHDELVHRVVSEAGGRVVKGLGDGAMACFGSAADAVGAAVRVQQVLDRLPAEHRLGVRVGLAAGDVQEVDGDLFGTPVVEASRLCAAAGAGEVLAAELVRLLARGRCGDLFEPLGALVLRGLPEPVAACRVLWSPAPDEPAPLPLPAALAGPPAAAYAGRVPLRAALREAWAGAAGGLRTVLLSGEPGIGKTRTAAELAREVHAAGGTVLFGRCDEGLAVPYQPFVEALTGYAQARPTALGRLPGELTRLVPELRRLAPGVGEPVVTDVRSEEYRLFEAVTSWLAAASTDRGLLLVLDDLHWAAVPTVQLLQHVLRRLPDEPGARVLVLGTYRDTDLDRRHPLTAALADLRRLPGTVRLPLTGLSAEEVLQLLQDVAGHELEGDARALAGALHAETEGNPFFVGEVLRHLVETGAVRRVEDRWLVPAAMDVDIPEGVRDVVGRRVSRLGPQAGTVLAVAAVIGREVSVDVLACVAGLDEEAVGAALDEGVRARLLQETRADHYRFSHALVRTTLYDELSATRRRRLHLAAAEALARLHPDEVVAQAHHLLHAAPRGAEVARAAQAALAAGEQALARRAPADAATWFRHVLELLEGAPDGDRLRLTAAVGLGRAQRDQGDASFRETLLEASAQAHAAGHADLLVAAVLVNQRGFTSIMGGVDAARVEAVERALSAVPEPSCDRARLLALLASESVFRGDPRRARALAGEAVALVREVGDEPTVAAVLAQACGPSFDPDDLAGWRRLTREAVECAARLGDPALEAVSTVFWSAALLADGEVAAARAVTERLQSLAAACGPPVQWAARAQQIKFVVAERPPDEAAAANDACLALGEAVGDLDRFNWWAASAVCVHIVREHTIDALLDVTAHYADEFPGTGAWRASQALALADSGRTRAALDLLAAHGVTPERIAQEPFPCFGPSVLARVALRCGDRPLAAAAEAVLAPHVHGWSHYFTGVVAPVAMPLAMCASVLGRHDEAVALADRAVEQTRTAGFASLLLVQEVDLAQVLLRRGTPQDRRRAAELVADLAARADVLGCSGTATYARALVRRRDGAREEPRQRLRS